MRLVSKEVNFYEQTMGANFTVRQLSVRDIAIHTYGDNAWVEFYWDFFAKLRKDGRPLTTHGARPRSIGKSTEEQLSSSTSGPIS